MVGSKQQRTEVLTTERSRRPSARWRGRPSRKGTVGDAQRKGRHAGAPSSAGRTASPQGQKRHRREGECTWRLQGRSPPAPSVEQGQGHGRADSQRRRAGGRARGRAEQEMEHEFWTARRAHQRVAVIAFKGLPSTWFEVCLQPHSDKHVRRHPRTNDRLWAPSGKPKREEVRESADTQTPQGGAGNSDSEGSKTETKTLWRRWYLSGALKDE